MIYYFKLEIIANVFFHALVHKVVGCRTQRFAAAWPQLLKDCAEKYAAVDVPAVASLIEPFINFKHTKAHKRTRHRSMYAT